MIFWKVSVSLLERFCELDIRLDLRGNMNHLAEVFFGKFLRARYKARFKATFKVQI